MSNSSDLAGLQRAVQDFCEARKWGRVPFTKKIWQSGRVTEAAELVEPFRFRSDSEVEAYVQTPEGRENLQDELADVFFFLLRISQRNGVDLGQALRAKLLKNAAKYPVSK
jgi:NTP pyrophosphatase (non-canonical NTP hydrolase)